jgi:hypothetical protein
MDPWSVEWIGTWTARRVIALARSVITLRTGHRAECTDGVLSLLVACLGRRRGEQSQVRRLVA